MLACPIASPSGFRDRVWWRASLVFQSVDVLRGPAFAGPDVPAKRKNAMLGGGGSHWISLHRAALSRGERINSRAQKRGPSTTFSRTRHREGRSAPCIVAFIGLRNVTVCRDGRLFSLDTPLILSRRDSQHPSPPAAGACAEDERGLHQSPPLTLSHLTVVAAAYGDHVAQA